ncbi:UPF0175 family protein [Magnetospirillum sp. SS-4]|uniref:UPF0175 family protein n=1 Tax=Magnetospirillum sp. SS-4 TaxID=2681465 RepID=UPI001384D8FF|nr:UPF0175 family protein [Magnetospirillum sp. SS-4]CAA7624380.1 hypothetical protein MTBSS4_460024 [Magnetospirillum sp. SS-4]
MAQKLVIEFELPASVDIPPDLVADKGALRDAVAVVLYKQNRLTMLQARSIMGLSRREFEEQIGSFGVAMMDVEDLPHELDAATWLFDRA